MVRAVVWNKRAEKELDNIVEYLIYKWGNKVTEEYLARVKSLTEFIVQYPEAGICLDLNKEIRSFSITKHAKIIYRIGIDKIIILNVFDNRQAPEKLKF